MKFSKFNFLFILLLNSHIIVSAQARCKKCPESSEMYKTTLVKPFLSSPSRYPWICAGNCKIDDSIKARLLYLLEPNWTTEEIELYINKQSELESIEFKENSIDSLISINSNSKIELDSLKKTRHLYFYQEIKNGNVDKGKINLLKVIANIGLREAVPIIEKNLKTYDFEIAKLVLARFGNEKFQKEIIKDSKPIVKLNGTDWLIDFTKKGTNLRFLGTQQSVYELINWIDTTKTYGRKSEIKSANEVIYYLNCIILNKDFKDKLEYFIKLTDGDIRNNNNPELYIFCKNWLLQNKGNYVINPNIYEWL